MKYITSKEWFNISIFITVSPYFLAPRFHISQLWSHIPSTYLSLLLRLAPLLQFWHMEVSTGPWCTVRPRMAIQACNDRFVVSAVPFLYSRRQTLQGLVPVSPILLPRARAITMFSFGNKFQQNAIAGARWQASFNKFQASDLRMAINKGFVFCL